MVLHLFNEKIYAPDFVVEQLLKSIYWRHRDFYELVHSVTNCICNRFLWNEDELFARLGLPPLPPRPEIYEPQAPAPHESNRLDIDQVRTMFGAVYFLFVGASIHKTSANQLRWEIEHLGCQAYYANTICNFLSRNRARMELTVCQDSWCRKIKYFRHSDPEQYQYQEFNPNFGSPAED